MATESAIIIVAQAWSPETRKAVSLASAKDTAVSMPSQVPPRGNETLGCSSKETAFESPGDVESDVAAPKTAESPLHPPPDTLAELVARLASLPPEVVAALQALFGGQTPPT
jgi:hypothetical protein